MKKAVPVQGLTRSLNKSDLEAELEKQGLSIAHINDSTCANTLSTAKNHSVASTNTLEGHATANPTINIALPPGMPYSMPYPYQYGYPAALSGHIPYPPAGITPGPLGANSRAPVSNVANTHSASTPNSTM